MEGTSGAAERALLRGRAREAALSWRARGSGLLDAPTRERRDSEAVSYREAKPTPDDADVSGRRIVTKLRQEVSEPIGLGRSFHRERSWWKKPSERPKPSPSGP